MQRGVVDDDEQPTDRFHAKSRTCQATGADGHAEAIVLVIIIRQPHAKLKRGLCRCWMWRKAGCILVAGCSSLP